MTLEIILGDTQFLPDAAAFDGTQSRLACSEADAAYGVLRRIMDYGYAHSEPAFVQLVCADESVAKAYRFQWNMWYAERKPD